MKRKLALLLIVLAVVVGSIGLSRAFATPGASGIPADPGATVTYITSHSDGVTP